MSDTEIYMMLMSIIIIYTVLDLFKESYMCLNYVQ